MTIPDEPNGYQRWLDEIERTWKAGLIPAPQAVAGIVMNARREVLLQLRENAPQVEFGDCWTLPGGGVEEHETPDQAAGRELAEETGLRLPMSRWRIYQRRHPSREFIIEQHIYTSQSDQEPHELILGEGQALRYFGQEHLAVLPIAFGFERVVDDFLTNSRYQVSSAEGGPTRVAGDGAGLGSFERVLTLPPRA